MYDLIRWLKSEGVEVYLVDMDKKGMCIINKKTILISSKMSEHEQIKVTRHELKHFEHKDFFELYKQFVYRSKFEFEADNYMIDSFIEENDHQFNYSMIMEEFNIGIGYDTRYQKVAK